MADRQDARDGDPFEIDAKIGVIGRRGRRSFIMGASRLPYLVCRSVPERRSPTLVTGSTASSDTTTD